MTTMTERPGPDKEFDSIIDRAILGSHQAQFDQGERNGALAREIGIMTEKAGEAAYHGFLKGMAALRRASENPGGAKQALREVFMGGFGKMRGLFVKD